MAIKYIKSMDINEKERLRIMLFHNIFCGKDFAIKHGIDPIMFNNELKNVLGGNQ